MAWRGERTRVYLNLCGRGGSGGAVPRSHERDSDRRLTPSQAETTTSESSTTQMHRFTTPPGGPEGGMIDLPGAAIHQARLN